MFLRGNHRDRWLLTYADFITLLFATFVLMYATAKAKEGSKLLPANPVSKALEPASPLKAAVQSNLLTDLQKSLRIEQQSALVTVSVDQRGIVIALDDRTCFRPGQSRVEPPAILMFEKVAGILARYDNRILLEGHTDSVPIHTNQFRSNWELSTARSIAVMELMSGASAALHTERFLIGGSADNAPVTSNQSEQGRAHNRRVEIIVLDNPPPGSAFSPVAATPQ
jgi:chemotaxis protein MotB